MKLFLIFFLILPFYLSAQVTDSCCRSKYSEAMMRVQSIAKLSAEYKRLKNADEKSTENWTCCDYWNSDLHQLMGVMQEKLSKKDTPGKTIVKALGKPDEKSSAVNYSRYIPEEMCTATNTVLVYYWRGRHDWMYFVLKDDKVIYSEWWMAYE